MTWYDPDTGEDVSPWVDNEDLAQRATLKKKRAASVAVDFDRMTDSDHPLAVQELLELAAELDAEARHNEELAAVAWTNRARKRLLWEANQKRGAAVRRWRDAQRAARGDEPHEVADAELAQLSPLGDGWV